jgi:hypothetical protein
LNGTDPAASKPPAALFVPNPRTEAMPTADPTPPELLALAPNDLPALRDRRFDGTGFETPLARFAPDDRALVGRIYDAVQGLSVFRRGMGPDPDVPALEEHIRRVGAGGLMADAARLGDATRAAGLEDAAVRRVAHDVRGGGLTVLLGTADLLDLVPGDAGLVRACVDSARDHAKIMRNLLPDIDPAVRAADEAAKAHGIGHFVAKWDGTTVPRDGAAVTVRVKCSFVGDITARCLETSSIDRVVYNYVNNAVRFAADGAVTLWIFPVGDGLVRWVVVNRVAADQAAFLAANAPDLARLYAGGVTRGGTGVGLANCAEVVAACFGLADPQAAVAAGYLGAAARGDTYYAWFHWPAVAAD